MGEFLQLADYEDSDSPLGPDSSKNFLKRIKDQADDYVAKEAPASRDPKAEKQKFVEQAIAQLNEQAEFAQRSFYSRRDMLRWVL